ncbi:MAG: HD domain-containing protein [Desulfovibrio sp.]|nr:HD domain-containing protein [Desulfovibrio sp.]
MILRLWGTRGAFPVSSKQMSRYGGDTSCIEIQGDAGERVIIDAGTGITLLGERLMQEEPGECDIFITHPHWDHILGLPSFKPLSDEKWRVRLHGPAQKTSGEFSHCIRDIVAHGSYDDKGVFASGLDVEEFEPGAEFTVGALKIRTCRTRHRGICTAYRIDADGWSVGATGVHEFGASSYDGETADLLSFLAGVDVAIVDGHWFMSEYVNHVGSGHSAMEQWPEPLAARGVRHVVFTHFAPSHTDADLEMAFAHMMRQCRSLSTTLQLARQRMEITPLGGDETQPAVTKTDTRTAYADLFEFFHRLAHYNDINSVLESILSKARALTGADAGTVYLVEDGKLDFAYAENDTLFPGSEAKRCLYLKASLPLNATSIAGFVACTGRSLNIADVRRLKGETLYSFNDSFDAASGYKTVSVLSVPFVDATDRTLGVLQLINSMQDGVIQPFTDEMVDIIEHVTTIAVSALERGRMADRLILRMLRTSSLHDPHETAHHIWRTGAMAAELYRRWAEKKGLSYENIRQMQGKIRLAVMTHDVGKVGIPDAILKKPGPLTPEERAVMQKHTSLGATLFSDTSQGIDRLARTIALNHHQRWDGTGYTGSPDAPILSGEDIPLEARITAIVDVYDALVSRRSYKEAWDEKRAFDQIRDYAGSYFDPALVDIFVELHDVIRAIYRKYPDDDETPSKNPTKE